MKKITFITYHNWETKRHGGFHQFAEYAALQGLDVIFFSFSRPYYIRYKHEERLNSKVLSNLTKGRYYNVGNNKLLNVTWPTLALPGPIRKFFSYRVNEWLMTHSFKRFDKFFKKYLDDCAVFVFESNESVLLVDKIKAKAPNARIIYRPSDPLWEFSNDFFNEKGEENILAKADLILTVNENSISAYKEKFPTVFNSRKYICVPNGVNVSAYQIRYPKPELLNYPKTACYIGSFPPDWELVFATADDIPQLRIVIITPHAIPHNVEKQLKKHDNLFYVDGINPSEVPVWITNCDIVLQPFPAVYGHMLKQSLGLTAKNYKAMAAKKPIVTHQIPLNLSRYGLITTDNKEDFIKGVKDALSNNHPHYSLDVKDLDWGRLCQKFLECCLS